MDSQTELIKKPAPTLYAIIGIKLLKGVLFLTLAIVAYNLSDNDLPKDFQKLLHHLRFNPERKFWADLAKQIGGLTEAKVLWAAIGTLIYSLFSWVEGIGMIFRVSWAGWMAICESAFFIPIEVYELIHHPPPNDPAHRGHPILVAVVLIINIWIVWYLAKNKGRLFRHHHHHH
jgi:uncharacterized membrane protein (DUF2068 family)